MHNTMANSAVAPLQPTWNGYLASTWDAMLVMEASLQGLVRHIPRRPHDRERGDLIKSGNVFVYEEGSSGIKRWTDGSSWSPSRIMCNYLIYRELDAPFPPGEKKRAIKKSQKRPLDDDTTMEVYNNSFHGVPNQAQNQVPEVNRDPGAMDSERALYGSLVDSYNFKNGGLMKKTFSIKLNDITHHLVSYYMPKDVIAGQLKRPTGDPLFDNIFPRDEILFDQTFRFQLDPNETGHHLARYNAAVARHSGHHQVTHSMMANPAMQGGYFGPPVGLPPAMSHMESSPLDYNPGSHFNTWANNSAYGPQEAFDTHTANSFGDHASLSSHQGLPSFSAHNSGLPTPGYETNTGYDAGFPAPTNYAPQHTYSHATALPPHGHYPSYSPQGDGCNCVDCL